MHLKQTEFTYSSFEPFTKSKEKSQILKKQDDSRYIHRNKLDKACFQHDMAYGDLNTTIHIVELLRKLK